MAGIAVGCGFIDLATIQPLSIALAKTLQWIAAGSKKRKKVNRESREYVKMEKAVLSFLGEAFGSGHF